MAQRWMAFLLLMAATRVRSQGPASVPGQGIMAGLNPNASSFKEEDYLGAQAERQRYTDASDFIYNFPAQEGSLTVGQGGSNALHITVDNKPSLERTTAMSQELFTLGPCGLNVPHFHPRAAKVLHVVQGEVNVGFVEEGSAAMARTFMANLTVGQSITIPRGLAMWVHNLNCSQAQFLDTWSNADPGIQNMVPSLLKMPVVTVATALNIDTASASALVARAASPIPQGPEECLTRCNIAASSPLSAAAPSAISTLTQPLSEIATLTTG